MQRNSCANTLAKLVQLSPEIYCALLVTNNAPSGGRTDLFSNFMALMLASAWLKCTKFGPIRDKKYSSKLHKHLFLPKAELSGYICQFHDTN